MISLSAIPWRLIGAGVAVAVVAGFIWKAHATRLELHKERAARIAAESKVAEFELADKVDTEVAKELATFRQQQHVDMKDFTEKLKVTKLTREVHYVSEKGEPVVCVERDRREYRRLHNEAVTAAPDP